MAELAREIIVQKIKSLENNLTVQSYEVASLRDLLSKIDEATGKVASVKVPKVSSLNEKSGRPSTRYLDEAIKNAKAVSKYMKANPRILKTVAIKELLMRGELITRPTWKDPVVSIKTQTSPSVLGTELFVELFRKGMPHAR